MYVKTGHGYMTRCSLLTEIRRELAKTYTRKEFTTLTLCKIPESSQSSKKKFEAEKSEAINIGKQSPYKTHLIEYDVQNLHINW